MHVNRLALAALLASSSLSAVANAAQAAAWVSARQVRIDVPAGDLASALRSFSRQTHVEVLFSAKELTGRRSAGVRGFLLPSDALVKIVEGSGAEIVSDPSGAYLVRVAGISSDAARNGQAVSSLGEGTTPRSAVQEAIVVTGTNIRGVGVIGSAVKTYDRTAIERSGAADFQQLSQKMPENFSSVNSGVANFYSSPSGGSQTSGLNNFGGAGFNLRGLGPGATLTLLDGRRISPAGSDGSGVDISLIPLAAVDQVQILLDGASAIYGSDAVAGVVNIKLKDTYSGASSSFQFGGATRGGADEIIGSQLLGTNWKTGNALITYEHESQSEISASERDFVPPLPGRVDLLPRQHRNSVFATARQEIGSQLSITLDGFYSDREFRQYTDNGLQTLTQGSAKLKGGSVDARYKPVGDWQFDLSAGYSTVAQPNRTIFGQEFTSNSPNLSLLDVHGGITGTIFQIPGGDVKIATGGEFRKERLSDRVTSSFLPPASSKLARTVSSGYLELSVPFVSEANSVPLLRLLSLSAAARYDHYSDFGSATNSKVGVAWAPVKGVKLRGSYGTSFRAPYLTQLVDDKSYVTFNVPDTSSPAGVTDTMFLFASGNPALGPEKARSYSLGVDVAPDKLPSLRASVSYYHTAFRDQITSPPVPSIFDVWNDAAFLTPFITRPADPAFVQGLFARGLVIDVAGLGPDGVVATFDDRLFNLSTSTQSGLDFSAAWDHQFNFSRLGVSATVVRTLQLKQQVIPAGPTVSFLNEIGEPVKWRSRISVDVSHKTTGLNIAANYTGSYRNTLISPTQQISSWLTFDAQLRYKCSTLCHRVLRGLSATLNAQNIFDRAPPKVGLPPLFFPVGYDPANASALGRVISLQLKEDW